MFVGVLSVGFTLDNNQALCFGFPSVRVKRDYC
jgi:hypothetical protein